MNLFWFWLKREMKIADICSHRLSFHSNISELSICGYQKGMCFPSFKDLMLLCYSLALVQNKNNGWNLSKSEINILSDKMIIEATRIM